MTTWGPAEILRDFNAYDSKRTEDSNVVAEDGALSLYTREVAGKGWRGASLVLETPITYGHVAVEVRSDPAPWTKALLLMIYPPPKGPSWPPEVDFMELGGDKNWDRHKTTATVHYDPANLMIHCAKRIDMTQWRTVEMYWGPDLFEFYVDDQIVGKRFPNPGVTTPLKLHMTYWPTHKAITDPWPVAPSRMQIGSVTVE